MNIIDDLRVVQSRIELARVKVAEAIDALEGLKAIAQNHEKKISPELTATEKEILKLLGEGLDTHAVGERLGVSKKTIEAHRDNIRKKVGAGSSHDLLRMLKEGLI